MALRDYILCAECGRKIIYDGYDRIRDRLEEEIGDPDSACWTVGALCQDHSGDGSIKFMPPAPTPAEQIDE